MNLKIFCQKSASDGSRNTFCGSEQGVIFDVGWKYQPKFLPSAAPSVNMIDRRPTMINRYGASGGGESGWEILPFCKSGTHFTYIIFQIARSFISTRTLRDLWVFGYEGCMLKDIEFRYL